jgi:hypothetical protein
MYRNPKISNSDIINSLLSLKLFFPKSKALIRTNKNKEENPYFNEDFIEKISESDYIKGNNTFKSYLDSANKDFKSIITKLLKKYRKKSINEFNYIINSIKNKFEDNINSLFLLIKTCVFDELEYIKVNNKKTKIYPYTNFIIAYFAIYLIIINIIFKEINSDD